MYNTLFIIRKQHDLNTINKKRNKCNVLYSTTAIKACNDVSVVDNAHFSL